MTCTGLPSSKSLPAATATNTPFPTAYLIALSSTGDEPASPAAPRLMLITLAPLSAAYRMPLATSSSVPPMSSPQPNRTSQTPESTLTGMIRMLKATPAVPTLSLVSWPAVPLTCVPWPSKSSGGSVVQTDTQGPVAHEDRKVLGATNRDEAP